MPANRSVFRYALRWLGLVAFVGLVAVGIAVCIEKSDEGEEEPKTVALPPFEPVTLLGFHVETTEVKPGGSGILRNGFCVAGEVPVVVEIFIGLEYPGFGDPSLAKPSYPLQGTADTPEGRERFPLDPGCVATEEPLLFDIPSNAEQGEYRLYIHILVNGPNAQSQDIVQTSNTFMVVP